MEGFHSEVTMEERKLNLNAPLLSVRRFSSPIRAAEVRKETKVEDDSKLGRRCSLPNCSADRSSLELQVTDPVAVPFHWEQIPGRRKDGGGGGRGYSRFPVRWVPAIVKDIKDDKKLKVQTPVTPLKSGSRMSPNEDEGHEDDDDGKFSDALESLSAMDSCSMKCSVSGVGGSDCLAVKPSGNFETDPQTRDFMMSRFLPAAKAMTLEQPQYAKKQQQSLVAVEQQSRQIVVKPKVNRLESAIVPYNRKEVEKVESEEEEDDDDEYEESLKIPSNACGFFPRLCFRKSAFLLNPVPGMKANRLVSSTSSLSGKSKKPIMAKFSRSSSSTTKKSDKEAASQARSRRGDQSPRVAEVENKLFSGSASFNYSSDRNLNGRISPFSRRSGTVSPYRNSSAPQSPFQGSGPRPLSKEAEVFKRNKPYLYCKGGSKSQELTPLYRTKTTYASSVSSLSKISSDSSDVKVCTTGKELMVVASPASYSQSPIGDRVETSHDDSPGEYSKALVCVEDLPVPPQLPRTPSESWLWRTLPGSAVSSRSPASRSPSFRSKWLDSKSSKWETMVKSSYMHHDHVRYSEELVPYSSSSQHLTS